jgi:integrase
MAIRPAYSKKDKDKEKKKPIGYDVIWTDPKGKQKWKRFEKKGDATAFDAEIKAAKRKNRYAEVIKEKPEYPFNQLVDKYIEINGKQKCFKEFKAPVIPALRKKFDDKLISKIDYLDLLEFRKERMEKTTKGGKVRAAGSVNGDLAILGHMLSSAVEWGWLETSPFKKGKSLMLKLDNKRTRFLTEPEIGNLLKECPNHLRPIVEVAMLTGMRRGELLSLKWDQIKHGAIHLDGSMTKSGKGRKIQISDRLEMVLKELRRENHLKSPYVFNYQGKRLQEVKRSFQGACRRAGIEDFRFHDLRHTFASRLVMRGASLKAVQELLGHADLSMTMRYSHLSQEHLKDTVNLLNDTPDIRQTLDFPQKAKKADNHQIANLL